MSSEVGCSNDFYTNAQEYWAEVPPTIDGMLGGFAFISQKDIKGSKLLLKQLFNSNKPPENKYALDCGAGIGRVTKHLLIDLFDKVDLVEQNHNFLSKAKTYIGPTATEKVGNLYSTGLQSFDPEPGKYDLIWMQWVLGHLTDSDLIRCFNNCGKALKPNGVIVIKENITSSGTIEMDKNDSSFTRPISLLKKLFEDSNLECYKQLKQHDFPKGLYPVYMFVLKPKHQDHEEIIDKSVAENIDDKSIAEDMYKCVDEELPCQTVTATSTMDEGTKKDVVEDHYCKSSPTSDVETPEECSIPISNIQEEDFLGGS